MSISYLDKTGLEHIGDIVHTDKTTQARYSMQGSNLELENTTENARLYTDIVGNENGSTGLQNIKINGKNLFNKENIINASLNASNGSLSSDGNFRTVYFECKPSTTYTIQKIVSNRFTIGFSSDNEINLPMTLHNQVGLNTSLTEYTFTTGSNDSLVFIMVSKTSDDTVPLNNIINSIQIEKGEESTYYEEYKNQNYGINLGENLFHFGRITNNYEVNGTKKGITYNGKNSELLLNGTTNDSGFIFQNISDSYTYISAGTYTVSALVLDGSVTNNNGDIKLFIEASGDSTYQRIVTLDSANNYTTTQNFTIYAPKEIRVACYSSGSGIITNNFKIGIQIDKGSQATSYSQYFKPITLSSTDKIYKKDNSWYLKVSGTDTEITSSNYPELLGQLQDLDNAYTYNNVTYVNTSSDTSNKISTDLYYDKTRFLNVLDKVELESEIKSIGVYWDN